MLQPQWVDEVFEGGVHGADRRLLRHKRFKQALDKAEDAYRETERLNKQEGFVGPTAAQAARSAFLDELTDGAYTGGPSGEDEGGRRARPR